MLPLLWAGKSFFLNYNELPKVAPLAKMNQSGHPVQNLCPVLKVIKQLTMRLLVQMD
jgi:hypothetical protein